MLLQRRIFCYFSPLGAETGQPNRNFMKYERDYEWEVAEPPILLRTTRYLTVLEVNKASDQEKQRRLTEKDKVSQKQSAFKCIHQELLCKAKPISKEYEIEFRTVQNFEPKKKDLELGEKKIYKNAAVRICNRKICDLSKKKGYKLGTCQLLPQVLKLEEEKDCEAPCEPPQKECCEQFKTRFCEFSGCP